MQNFGRVVVSFLALTLAASASAASVYKCVDKATGRATFSEMPCPSGEGEKKRFSGNSATSLDRHRDANLAADDQLGNAGSNNNSAPAQPSDAERARKERESKNAEACAKAQKDYQFESMRIGNEKGAYVARTNMQVACSRY